jgi:hypothetical protein
MPINSRTSSQEGCHPSAESPGGFRPNREHFQRMDREPPVVSYLNAVTVGRRQADCTRAVQGTDSFVHSLSQTALARNA